MWRRIFQRQSWKCWLPRQRSQYPWAAQFSCLIFFQHSCLLRIEPHWGSRCSQSSFQVETYPIWPDAYTQNRSCTQQQIRKKALPWTWHFMPCIPPTTLSKTVLRQPHKCFPELIISRNELRRSYLSEKLFELSIPVYVEFIVRRWIATKLRPMPDSSFLQWVRKKILAESSKFWAVLTLLYSLFTRRKGNKAWFL